MRTRVIGSKPLVLAAVATTALLAAPQARAAGTDKVPGPFVAKLYTEGLGRGPDPSGWSAFLRDIGAAGCGRESLAQAARSMSTVLCVVTLRNVRMSRSVCVGRSVDTPGEGCRRVQWITGDPRGMIIAISTGSSNFDLPLPQQPTLVA